MLTDSEIFLINRMNITAWKTQLGTLLDEASSGTAALAYRETAASDDVEASDYMVCSTGASAVTLTLPLAASVAAGKRFELVMSGSGQLTIAPSGSDTIAGVSGNDATLAQYGRRVLTSDGVSNWIL